MSPLMSIPVSSDNYRGEIIFDPDPVDLEIIVTHISPLPNTYNPTPGIVDFVCHVKSKKDISATRIIINKYYGGWEVRKEYYTETQLHPGDSDTDFDLTFSVNLTNGFYTWECVATDINSKEGSSENNFDWKYKTGKGTVYIHHSIHAEPKDLVSGVFKQTLDLSDFDQGGTIDRVMEASHREEFTDSYGTPATYTWLLRMDELACVSDLGCTATLDELLYDDWNFLQEIQNWNDGLGWHFHHMDWFNGTQYMEQGGCPDTGCQPGQYWNQILTMNGTTYRNRPDTELGEKILSRLIIDYGFYPISSAMGWFGMTNQINEWLSKYIPFNYDNLYGKLGDTTFAEPINNVYDWTIAPGVIYSPSSENYQIPGENSNFCIPCLPGGLNKNDTEKLYVRNTFELADQGTNIILCHYSHSFQSFPPLDMRHNVMFLHYQLDSERGACWSAAYEGICVDELFPEVKYEYLNDREMIQAMFELTDYNAPEISITKINKLIVIESSEELWNDYPIIAYQNAAGFYYIIPRESIIRERGLTWIVDVAELNIERIRAAAIDKSYNTGFSSIILKETCGSMNDDPIIDVTDLIYLVEYMYVQGPAPAPDVCVADVDGTGGVDLSDLVYLTNYFFNAGPAPGGNCCD